MALASTIGYVGNPLWIEFHYRWWMLGHRKTEESGGVLDAGKQVFQLEPEMLIQELAEEIVVCEVLVQ